MKDGPRIASIAALIGDPARAEMLGALMDGRSLTASELAEISGVTRATASGHLSRLSEADLVSPARQGRHRYFRLSGPDVAETLEALMGLAQRTGAVRARTGPQDRAMREARACYDHLAGEIAVAAYQGMLDRGLIVNARALELSAQGRAVFERLGVDFTILERSRRPLCRACLDWSERRSHLGGALGAAFFDRLQSLGWVRRTEGRTVLVTSEGRAQLSEAFGALPAASAD